MSQKFSSISPQPAFIAPPASLNKTTLEVTTNETGATYDDLYNWAESAFQRADYQEAARLWERALNIYDQDYNVFVRLASAYELLGLKDASVDILDKGVSLVSDEGFKKALKGYIFIVQDKIAEATKEYREAYKTHPNEVPINATLGWLLLKMGNINESIQQLEKAVKLLPESHTIYHSDIFHTLGIALAQAGRVRDAETILRRASRLDPTSQEIQSALAWCALKRGGRLN